MVLVKFCWGCKVDVEYGFIEDGMWVTWNLLFCGGGVGEGVIFKIGLASYRLNVSFLLLCLPRIVVILSMEGCLLSVDSLCTGRRWNWDQEA